MKNTFTYRMYYEDTDAGGIVYYANYLKFLERARTDFLLEHGISQLQIAKDGILFVVKKCEIEYFLPARLEDEITVSCNVSKISFASVIFEQNVTMSGTILAKALVVIVCVSKVDGILRPNAIPKNVENLLSKIM